MKTVKIPIIKSDEDLIQALKTFEKVFMAPEGSAEADERAVLALVIEDYEKRQFPIGPPDAVSAILFAMEQRNISKTKVAELLGGAPRLSEIMRGRRQLTLSQIRTLHQELHIPLESLIGSATPGQKHAS